MTQTTFAVPEGMPTRGEFRNEGYLVAFDMIGEILAGLPWWAWLMLIMLVLVNLLAVLRDIGRCAIGAVVRGFLGSRHGAWH